MIVVLSWSVSDGSPGNPFRRNEDIVLALPDCVTRWGRAGPHAMSFPGA